MKRLLLIAVVLMSGSAMATEWTQLPTRAGQPPSYLGELKPGTHQFTLSMLQEIDGSSMISTLRGDCLTRELFIDSITRFSEPMGKGNILSSATVHQLKILGIHTQLNSLVNEPGAYKTMLDNFCIKGK
jgi:hypothetical protein